MCIETSQLCRFESPRHLTKLIAILICLSFSALAGSADLGTAPQLPELLEQQGWRNQSDAHGNVYYHPPKPSKAAGQAEEAIASEIAQVDIPRLLLERGWRIETNVQGDMLLLPVKPPAPLDIDQMLRERGWRILTDVDGNTLLMPLAPTATKPAGTDGAAPTSYAEPAPATVEQPVMREPTAQFRQALEGKGWTVQTGSDGSMIIYPPASALQAPRTREIAGYGYCEGILLAGEEVQRPIDSEEKAKMLSVAWIALYGHADYEVGKARRINQVYVVSIVESAPPHTLRNQLVVREDGRVIAVY